METLTKNINCCDCLKICSHKENDKHYWCPKHANNRLDVLLSEAQLSDWERIFQDYVWRQRIISFLAGLATGLAIAVLLNGFS